MRRLDLVLGMSMALAAALPAQAGERGFEPAAYWTLSFGGGQPAATGYGFNLLGRAADAAPIEVARLDVRDQGLLASIAGLRFGRDLRLEQAEGEAAGTPGPRPWYAQRWMWWTGLGLAATVAAVTGSDDPGAEDSDPLPGDGDDDDGGAQGGVLCVDGSCVIPCDSGGPIVTCNELLPRAGDLALDRRVGWLDEGTGGMGELVAR